MNSCKPGVIGKRVTLTLVDGSVVKSCWYQHDGSFVVANPYLQVPADETIWVDLRDVQDWKEEVEVPDELA